MPGLMGFYLGSFLVAAEARIPVVPIVISGTRSALRGGRGGQWCPRPSNISVHTGKPVRPDGGDFSAAVRLRDAVRARMLVLCGEPDLALEKDPL
jgi:1-acyl-sn-glycerol-3-phosphate acyltransferase